MDTAWGGNLVINYAIRRRLRGPGIIVTSPGLWPADKLVFLKYWSSLVFRNMFPKFSVPNGIDIEALSRSENIIQNYNNDSLVHNRLTLRLGTDLLQAGKWAMEHANELFLPILIMQGSADRVVSQDQNYKFASRVGNNCTLKIWEGLFHELQNEPEMEDVLKYVIQWIENRLIS